MTITLATLAQATPQEVFNQVAKHMLAQGKRSAKPDDQNACLYRGPNGLKCAAGALIGDDEYVEDMDNNDAGTSWHGLVNRGQVPGEHFELIQELQQIHDDQSIDPALDWRRLLENYAYRKGFDVDF